MAITRIDDSDPVAPLENLFNTGYTEIEAEIAAAISTQAIKTFKWASVIQRTAQTGMTEGDIGDQADTNQRFRYSGTAWENITSGMILVNPTSAVSTGGTASKSATGIVTLSGATTAVSFNGAFTAAFDNYLIQYEFGTGTASELTLRLRNAGSDISLANYNSVRNETTPAPAANVVNQFGATSFGVGRIGGGGSAGSFEIHSPFVAKLTRLLKAESFDNDNYTRRHTGNYTATTSVDGFTLSAAAGTVTGTVRVYGYNNL